MKVRFTNLLVSALILVFIPIPANANVKFIPTARPILRIGQVEKIIVTTEPRGGSVMGKGGTCFRSHVVRIELSRELGYEYHLTLTGLTPGTCYVEFQGNRGLPQQLEIRVEQ